MVSAHLAIDLQGPGYERARASLLPLEARVALAHQLVASSYDVSSAAALTELGLKVDMPDSSIAFRPDATAINRE